MAEPSPVEINQEAETAEQHRLSVIGALAKRKKSILLCITRKKSFLLPCKERA